MDDQRLSILHGVFDRGRRAARGDYDAARAEFETLIISGDPEAVKWFDDGVASERAKMSQQEEPIR